MNRQKQNNRLSGLRCLFVLAAVCFLAVSTADAATPWKFSRTYTYKKWDYAQIEKENITLDGGTLDLVLSGKAANICPEGSERIRITWRFDQDISQFNPGDTFGAKLEARMTGVGGDCNGGLSYRTFAFIRSGVSSISWSDIVGKRMDGDRFQDKSGDRANPDSNGPNAESSVLMVSSGEPYPDRPLAGFVVYVGGPGGEMAYLYAYQPVSGGENGYACGYTLGSGIYNKWMQVGGENGFLGCARSNENEAGRSPKGTTGHYALFNGGVIIWHLDGAYAGRSFEVHGCIASLFQGMGGTNSWLGFPVSDEYSVSGGRRSDFEGGYIFWDAQTSRCQAYKY